MSPHPSLAFRTNVSLPSSTKSGSTWAAWTWSGVLPPGWKSLPITRDSLLENICAPVLLASSSSRVVVQISLLIASLSCLRLGDVPHLDGFRADPCSVPALPAALLGHKRVSHLGMTIARLSLLQQTPGFDGTPPAPYPMVTGHPQVTWRSITQCFLHPRAPWGGHGRWSKAGKGQHLEMPPHPL